jgi:chromosome partitioning protein
VRVSEAPSYAQPVLTYDGSSKGSVAYRALAKEILARHPLVGKHNVKGQGDGQEK